MDKFLDLGTYDSCDTQAITMAEWIQLYQAKTGITLNAGTMRKRRAMAQVGRLIPPKTYILTREEFEEVMRTPLPMCHVVVNGIA